MPYAYRIDRQLRVGVIQFWGTLAGSEFIEAFQVIASDAAWEAGDSILWDARAIEALSINPRDPFRAIPILLALADRVGTGRSAVVADRLDIYSAGYALNTLLPLRDREIQFFRTIDRALAWLGLDEACVPWPRLALE